MKSDLEIAQEAKLKPIVEIAKSIGLDEDDIEFYGKYKAKIKLEVLDKLKDNPNGKYIDVTATTPTPTTPTWRAARSDKCPSPDRRW